MVFDAQFTQAGDGDYLAVYWGRSFALYALADLPMTRDGLIRCEVELGTYAGQTNDLIIKLETNGAANCAARIENLGLCTDTDLDRDGLTTAQEAALGTSPQQHDTDGDGLSDGAEINTHQTNPLRADTDGDGFGDGDELASGTDPKNGASAFVMKSATRNANGSITLTWATVAGRTYRLVRGSEPGGGDRDVMVESLQATGSLTSATDSSPPGGRAFYWAELMQ